MKPPEIFSIIVRGVGLVTCVYAVSYLASLEAWPGAAIVGVCLLVIGIWLVRGGPGFEGGPGLVDFAYPPEGQDPASMENAPSSSSDQE